MSISDLASFFAQSILAVVIGWAIGDALLRRIVGQGADRSLPEGIGLPERALISVLGFLAFSVVLMVVHMITVGRLFSLPGLVPAAGLAVLVVGRRRRVWPEDVPWRRVGAALALLLALYAVPFLIGGSSIRSGDSPWHMGRTHHLLGGEILPGGPAPAFDLNGYPWGLHAVLATMVRLVPGSDPADALTSLSFLISCALPLAAACLARRVDPRAGWAAAACMALIGGFGWIQAGTPTFFTSPDAARYGADLMTASPNGVYALLPPALPRELGLALVGLMAVLVTFAARGERSSSAILLGASLGALGLLSVPMALNGSAWTVAGILVAGRARIRVLVSVFVPAATVFALWVLPVGIGFVTYGGFVDITPNLGREWPLSTALGSWGLLLPLTLYGIFLGVRSAAMARPAAGHDANEPAARHDANDRPAVGHDANPRSLLAFGAAAVVMLILAIARGVFEWQVLGVPHLLHQGRMWPPAHLVASAFAGLALTGIHRRFQARGRRAAMAGVIGVLALGVISPVFASLALTGIIRTSDDGFVYSDADFQEGSFLIEAGHRLGPDDVVEVPGAGHLDLFLFQFSGARVANFDDPRQATFDPRIRYRELADRWYERMTHGGFEAGYAVMPADRAPRSARIVARGRYGGMTFVLTERGAGRSGPGRRRPPAPR